MPRFSDDVIPPILSIYGSEFSTSGNVVYLGDDTARKECTILSENSSFITCQAPLLYAHTTTVSIHSVNKGSAQEAEIDFVYHVGITSLPNEFDEGNVYLSSVLGGRNITILGYGFPSEDQIESGAVTFDFDTEYSRYTVTYSNETVIVIKTEAVLEEHYDTTHQVRFGWNSLFSVSRNLKIGTPDYVVTVKYLKHLTCQKRKRVGSR